METFKWQVNGGLKENVEPLVNVVSFGDGYEQRQRKGLQPTKNTFSGSLTMHKNQAEEVMAFLAKHAGVSAFLWRGLKVKCTKWSRNHAGGLIYEINFEFEQVR